MTDRVTIAAMSGSLREGSYNTAALRTLEEMAPQGVDMVFLRIGDLPHYDADVEAAGWPEPVAALQNQLAHADAVLFATPEYNYSVPGVMKNAVDWLSRPVDTPPFAGKSPLNDKPAGIVGATPSVIGTARAQMHLRQIVFYNAMPLLPSAEVLITRAGEKFNAEGRLTDEETSTFLADFLKAFLTFIDRFRASAREAAGASF